MASVRTTSSLSLAALAAMVLTACSGSTGPIGPIGPAGPSGPSGPAGQQGIAGPAGATGPQGIQGIPGTPGTNGTNGAPGAPGAPGATGPTGPAGAQGVAGPAGPVGLVWQGAWAAGTAYVANDAVSFGGASYITKSATTGAQPPAAPWELIAQQGGIGPVGPAGATGPQGIQGIAGPVGPTGPQGIQGPIGLTGLTGSPGPVGPTGPAGANGTNGINGTNGVDGAPGAPGAQGIQGVAGLDGAPGAPGAQGIQGIQGPAGLDGAPGAPGAPGAQGIQGIQGPIGPQGIQGIQGVPGAGGGVFLEAFFVPTGPTLLVPFDPDCGSFDPVTNLPLGYRFFANTVQTVLGPTTSLTTLTNTTFQNSGAAAIGGLSLNVCTRNITAGQALETSDDEFMGNPEPLPLTPTVIGGLTVAANGSVIFPITRQFSTTVIDPVTLLTVPRFAAGIYEIGLCGCQRAPAGTPVGVTTVWTLESSNLGVHVVVP